MNKTIKMIAGFGAAAALALSLAGCGKGSVAATVNGENLYEEDVTAYVDSLRAYLGCENDDNWAAFMYQYGYTAESIRETAIDALSQEMLIEAKAAELGVTVSDEEIDATVAEQRTNLGYSDDAAWAEALAAAGYADEKAYREVIRQSLLQDAVLEAAVERTDPTDEEILNVASYFGGQEASHILVSDENTANDIAARITAAADKDAQFATELAASEDPGDGTMADEAGSLGWTSVNYMVYYYTLPNVASTLANMAVGDVKVVQESDGYHVVYCTDSWSPEADGSVDLSTIPASLLEEIKTYLSDSAFSTASSEFMTELKDSAEIVINDMPEGLSYDVDMSAYQTPEDTTGTDATGVELLVDEQGTYYLDADGNKVYVDGSDATSDGAEQ